MLSTLLFTTHLSGHGNANSRRPDLGMITLNGLRFVIVRILHLITMIVQWSLITIIGVVGRVIIVAIDDAFAWLANFEIALLAKHLAGHDRSALGVEDLSTCSAVVLSSKGSEGIATIETGLGILISHPEFTI
jgi:hypothetical protein